MVIRYYADCEGHDADGFESVVRDENGDFVTYKDYAELEAENARLRQERDAANAQLDFVLETLKEEKAP